MKDYVEFDVSGKGGTDKHWELKGWPSASEVTPIDLLATYVVNVQRAMQNELRDHRDTRPVPTSFDVTYSDDKVTTYVVRNAMWDNMDHGPDGLTL